MTTRYILPARSIVLLHNTERCDIHNRGKSLYETARASDFTGFITSKEVAYTDTDVFMNPRTNTCTPFGHQYGVGNSRYRNGEWWGIILPPNSKNCAFLLVEKDILRVNTDGKKINPAFYDTITLNKQWDQIKPDPNKMWKLAGVRPFHELLSEMLEDPLTSLMSNTNIEWNNP